MPSLPECRGCTQPVTASSPRTACPRCLSWFHGDCWEEGGCAGCPAVAPKRKRPDHVSIRVKDGELLIVERGFLVAGLVGVVLGAGILWLGVFSALNLDPEGHPLAKALLVLFFLASGAVILYAAIATALNRTELHVSKVRIEVWCGPLPWPGSTTVSLADLEQLYVEAMPMRGHALSVIRNGRATRLLHRGTKETLRFIEREIEEWLGITDQAVDGEAWRDEAPPDPGLPVCPACAVPLDRKARKVACNACFTWHHAACWRKDKSCAACRKRREDPKAAPVAAAPAAALPAPDPGGIDVLADDDELVLTFAWADVRPPTIYTLFVGLLMPVMFAVLKFELPRFPMWQFLLIEGLLAPFTLWVIYFYVAGWVNQTSIRVTPRELAVHHGPLPWLGLTAPRAQVERVAREVYSVQAYSRSGGVSTVDEIYELVAYLTGGKRVHLVRFIRDPAHANFLLREVQAHLTAP